MKKFLLISLFLISFVKLCFAPTSGGGSGSEGFDYKVVVAKFSPTDLQNGDGDYYSEGFYAQDSFSKCYLSLSYSDTAAPTVKLRKASGESGYEEYLKAYWKFDETTNGDTAYDSTLFSNSLTDHNGINRASGKVNNCAYLNASSSQYFRRDNPNGISMSGYSSISLSFWVKVVAFDVSSPLLILDFGTQSSDTFSLSLWKDSGGVFRLNRWSPGQGIEASSSGYSAGVWYHIVGIYDGNLKQLKLYVNGILKSTYSDTRQWDGNPLKFVATATTSFLTGYIDEMTIRTRVLSDKEVMDEYSNGVPYVSGQSDVTTLEIGKCKIFPTQSSGIYTIFIDGTPNMKLRSFFIGLK